MATRQELLTRANSSCELCQSTTDLEIYEVPFSPTDGEIICCATCTTQIKDAAQMDPNHWRCLNESMWSEVPAVQIMAWRMLYRLKEEDWARDLLDMMYMDEATSGLAKKGAEADMAEAKVVHKDSNGAILEVGDTVVLIKDLNVKGANFTAKRGTAVRRITLVADNAEHIEGKVEGQRIVILTKFVKKA